MDSDRIYKCGGGYPSFAFQHCLVHGGLASAKAYPYTGRYGVFQYKPKVVAISGYGRVPIDNELALKWAVFHGPVVASIEADEEFNNNSTGVYNKESRGNLLNHDLLIVGYGTKKNGDDYWVIQNSFGREWGKNGLVLMPRNRKIRRGYCNLARMAYYPTMVGAKAPFFPVKQPLIEYTPCRCYVCLRGS